MQIELNGQPASIEEGANLERIIELAGADPARRGVAVALEGEVVPRSLWKQTEVQKDQAVEVVAAIKGGAEGMRLGDSTFSSRLIAGSGGFRSLGAMESALAASGTEMITVALRRLDPAAQGSVMEVVDKLRLTVRHQLVVAVVEMEAMVLIRYRYHQ